MKKLFYLALLPVLFFQCKEDVVDPSASFIKIYDSYNTDLSFLPIDLVASDSGFLVLSENSKDGFNGVQVIKTDENGTYVRSQSLPASHVKTVGELITIRDSVYFFTMNQNYQIQLVRTSTSLSEFEIISLTGGQSFGLASSQVKRLVPTLNDSTELLLLSYNGTNGETELTKLNTKGEFIDGNTFSIGAGNDPENVTYQITSHFTDPIHSGLPFFCGEISPGNYYFNGFYNFHLSMIFTNLQSDPSGEILGQATNGGIAQALSLGGSNFALFGYQYNDNFISPFETVDTQSLSNSIDYLSTNFSEFRSRSKARIKSIELNTKTYTVFAAETEARQIALYFFDAATGAPAGLHKIGNVNPYTLSNIKIDEENNLLVLGTTKVAGRFDRIFLNKISVEELSGIVQ